MPVFADFDNLEPRLPRCRHLAASAAFRFFEDLMANEELHFTRAVRFKHDDQEGQPA